MKRVRAFFERLDTANSTVLDRHLQLALPRQAVSPDDARSAHWPCCRRGCCTPGCGMNATGHPTPCEHQERCA